MSTFAGIDNSIGWAHWRLRGGLKSVLGTALLYAGVLGGVIFLTLRANPAGTTRTLQGWHLGFIWIQAAMLVFFAGTRVGNAIRSDVTSRIIESHRLMPVSPLSAISGYLWGATAQPMIFCLINFGIGCLITLGARIQLNLLVAVNLVLLSFAVFVWVIFAFAAFIGRGATALVGLSIFLVAISASNGAMMMPGIMVLLTPLVGRSVFVTRMANADVSWALIASLLSQAYVGWLLFYGAARKYRRSEDTALGILPAMLLLIGWVGISYIALRWWSVFLFSPFPRIEERPVFLLHSTTVSSVVLATVAIANAARDPKWRRFSPWIALLCAGLISLGSLAPVDEPTPPHVLEITTLIIAASLVSTCFLLQIVYRYTNRGWPIAMVWLLFSWAVPFLIDFARWQLDTTDVDFVYSGISAASMLGAVIMLWDSTTPQDLVGGVVLQWVIALGLGLLAYQTAKRRRKVANA